jgi:REP element-mobilizing transposase RayT
MIKGKPPRLDRICIDQPLYYVTFCTLHRRPSLANDQVHEKFRSYCTRAADYNIGVGRYVIMPEHVHLFVRGDAKFELGTWIRGLKRAIPSGSDFWQPGFFDHILRSDESYSEKWNYVRDNPVRSGLVSDAAEWPYQGEIVWIDRA